jgi:hypothetical protein
LFSTIIERPVATSEFSVAPAPLRKTGWLAHDPAPPARQPLSPAHHHDLHSRRVVGDREVRLAHDRRGGSRARIELSRFLDAHVLVALAPADLGRARALGVEAVLRPIGDHEHAAAVVDRERVADRLAGAVRAEHAAAPSIERADDAAPAADEPQPPAPVRQGRVELVSAGMTELRS